MNRNGIGWLVVLHYTLLLHEQPWPSGQLCCVLCVWEEVHSQTAEFVSFLHSRFVWWLQDAGCGNDMFAQALFFLLLSFPTSNATMHDVDAGEKEGTGATHA